VLLIATVLSVNAELIMPGRWFTISTLLSFIALTIGLLLLAGAFRRTLAVNALVKQQRDALKEENDLMKRMLLRSIAGGYASARQLQDDPELVPFHSRDDFKRVIISLVKESVVN
jgi:hypothetical protein